VSPPLISHSNVLVAAVVIGANSRPVKFMAALDAAEIIASMTGS
jgi:hypothetical protein